MDGVADSVVDGVVDSVADGVLQVPVKGGQVDGRRLWAQDLSLQSYRRQGGRSCPKIVSPPPRCDY